MQEWGEQIRMMGIGTAGLRSGLSMPLKSLPADEHIPCELGFSTVLLEMTL